jgi:hypothetical protein
MGVVLVSRSATSGYLVDAVGGQGIDFNRPTELWRTSFGYPITDYRFPAYSYRRRPDLLPGLRPVRRRRPHRHRLHDDRRRERRALDHQRKRELAGLRQLGQ